MMVLLSQISILCQNTQVGHSYYHFSCGGILMVGFLIILVISLALYLYGTKKPNHKKVDQNPKANEVILPEIKSENQIPPKPVEREKAGPEREKTDPERKRT